MTSLEGSEAARERLKRIVDSLAGLATVAEVYAELVIGDDAADETLSRPRRSGFTLP